MIRRPANDPLIISYLTLRRLVGWIAVLLPEVLLAGGLLSSGKIDIYINSTTVVAGKLPASVSGYYYTGMRNVLVGTLCALGVFLIGYNGYDPIDRWTTNIAGILAIGVALFPTTPAVQSPSTRQQAIGDVHLTCAGLLFTLLAFMALRFAKTSTEKKPTTWLGELRVLFGFANSWPEDPERAEDPGKHVRARPADGSWYPSQIRRKKRRNMVYRLCALAIALSIALGFAANLLPVSEKKITPPLFWFETIAIVAFGVSWFVKGRSLLPAFRRRILRNAQSELPGTDLTPAREAQLVQADELAAVPDARTYQKFAERVSSGETIRALAPCLGISPQRAAELTAEIT